MIFFNSLGALFLLMSKSDKSVVVEALDVSKFFGKKLVLSGVSLKLFKGEVFGFLGPNGAGKSTLMKIIMGIERADAGTVNFLGRGARKHASSSVGIVPQEDFVYKDFSVKENLFFFGLLNNVVGAGIQKRVLFLLKWLGLEAFSDTRAGNLSGGYRKLLNIGCSIVHDPDIVFMDEPTVALDPAIRFGIWEKIVQMKKQGKTVCLTTHYLDEAQALCDRIAILSKGKIIAEDSPQNLVEKFGGKEVIKLGVEHEKPFEVIEKLRKEFPDYAVQEQDGEILLMVPKKGSFSALGKISAFLEKNNLKVVSSTIKEPGIDAVFLSLTGEKPA